jgi:transcriptional regulator with PAS, ATPase and Fis domain
MKTFDVINSLPENLNVSPFVGQIFETIERIALSGMSVLIVGEQGTEKESLARIVHLLSVRRNEKFISMDCEYLFPRIAEKKIFGVENLCVKGIEIYQGIFEKAYGGTIFFNNISKLSYELQVKISNTLRTRHFHRLDGVDELGINVRLITSINKPYNDIVTVPYRKADLYYRMCPLSINIPPLRERREDIIFMIDKFIHNMSIPISKSISGISDEALKYFLNYNWPGNTEQLQKAVEDSIMVCQNHTIEVNHLPSYLLKDESEFLENNFKSIQPLIADSGN